MCNTKERQAALYTIRSQCESHVYSLGSVSVSHRVILAGVTVLDVPEGRFRN